LINSAIALWAKNLFWANFSSNKSWIWMPNLLIGCLYQFSFSLLVWGSMDLRVLILLITSPIILTRLYLLPIITKRCLLAKKYSSSRASWKWSSKKARFHSDSNKISWRWQQNNYDKGGMIIVWLLKWIIARCLVVVRAPLSVRTDINSVRRKNGIPFC
jgi:hypothetical protein